MRHLSLLGGLLMAGAGVVGLAAQSDVSGYAATVREIVAAQAPPTQVAGVLYSINPAYQGVLLSICFRNP